MPNLQQQILALFAECDDDLRAVIVDVIRFEQENIHLREPRYKTLIMEILDRVARQSSEEETHEA